MQLWGRSKVGKAKELFRELHDQTSQIYESDDKEKLVPLVIAKIMELVETLDKMSEKDFEEFTEKTESLIDIDLALFIDCVIKNGEAEKGAHLADKSAAMLIGKFKAASAADLLRMVGETLFAEKKINIASDVFIEAFNISARMLEIANSSNDEEFLAYWIIVNEDINLWALACKLCLEKKVSLRNTQPLLDLLENGELIDRAAAARAIGVLKIQGALPNLIKCLGDKESRVRMEVLDALERIGDKSVIPAVKNCLLDRNESVRLHAAYVLKKIGDPTIIPFLEQMRKTEENESVKEAIDKAIEEIVDRESENIKENEGT